MIQQRDDWRLRYHLMPPDGWLNDPNGLCQKDGIYHVYFQYAPNEPAPDGRKARTWGHYAGPGLNDLHFAGVPFWPEEPDQDGCYSGSALIEGDVIRLYYTGNVKEPGAHDFIHSGRRSNTILVETKDGIEYGEKRVLLRTEDYPAGCTRHVRDPKVWKADGTYYMVLGARLQDDTGAVLLYESEDGIDWHYRKTIATKEGFGYMWECPDYFELGGRGYLSFCPQGVPGTDHTFQNLHAAGYSAVDRMCEEQEVLHTFHEWDHGFDFYAQQTFADEQGRRLMYAWVGMPDNPYENPTARYGWENALTVPRELIADGARIRQRPAAEIDALRDGAQDVTEDGMIALSDAAGEIEVQFPEAAAAEPWMIRFCAGAELSFTGGELTLRFDEAVGCGRTVRRAAVELIRDLRILVDTSLLEIFVNDGAFTMTSRFYPDYSDGRKLEIRCSCGDAKIRAWKMKTTEACSEIAGS